jgi:sugar fermentation stimulation protein A
MKSELKYVLASFIDRPNRFLAQAQILSSQELVYAHVPDPGRLKELLIPLAKVILTKSNNPTRKTQYSLIGVKNKAIWVNLDSQLSNRLFQEEFSKLPRFKNFGLLKAEFKYHDSRIDFLMENRKDKFNPRKTLIEVKSTTLVKDKIAMFPDAPTLRGTRHVNELKESLLSGFDAVIVFLVKRGDAVKFCPFKEMDPKFFSALKLAKQAGVEICAVLCSYDPIVKNEINIQKEIPIVGI